MNILIGILLIIYGFSVLNTGLKENFNIRLELRLFDSSGRLSPGIWRGQSVDERIRSNSDVELTRNQVENTDTIIGVDLGYELLPNLESEKSLLKISDNTISFVPSTYFGLLPNLDEIDSRSQRNLGVDFEVLKKNSQDIKVVGYVSNETYSRQNEELKNIAIFSRRIFGEAENAILLDINDIKIRDIRTISVRDALYHIGVLEADIDGFEKL